MLCLDSLISPCQKLLGKDFSLMNVRIRKSHLPGVREPRGSSVLVPVDRSHGRKPYSVLGLDTLMSDTPLATSYCVAS